MAAAAKDVAESAVAAGGVVIFSKSYCPYCRKAKGLFDSLGVPFAALELDVRPDGGAIQNYLQTKTGQRTVPNIFVNGQHVGGCDSVHDLHARGELKKLLVA
ncbi:thioredoxin reductase, partial [Cladochytrium tenue]